MSLPNLTAVAPLPRSFYVKLSAACFVLGGAMEGFMLATGFYDVVTNKEAERWLETLPERERLRNQLADHLQKKGLAVPEEKRS